MKSKTLLIALIMFVVKFADAQTLPVKHTISGFVTEVGSREQLPGVTIFVPGTSIGTVTNAYGFYSLKVPDDSITLVFAFVGFQKQTFRIKPGANLEMNIEMSQGSALKEVVVDADRGSREADNPRTSTISIPVSQIKEIPALFGEKDVLKVIQLMPGVQKAGEGNAGIYVRGGGPDQNLIILDEAPVYNANHLFGFFSIFNGDALKSVELTKGGFPARYGGRLSSVIDMRMKEGNKEKLHGEGGVGIIASRLTLEGPLVKGKSSFLVSARRTYIDVLAQPFLDPDAKGGYFFYDMNAKLNYELGKKDKIYLSGYFGSDKFYFKDSYDGGTSKGGLRWGNATATARWNHVHNGSLFSNTSLIYSRYRFNIFTEEKDNGDLFKLDYFSGIRDFTLKHDYDWYLNQKHQLKLGGQVTYHIFTPKATQIKDNSTTGISQDNEEKQTATEAAVYVEDSWRVLTGLRMNGGFRLSTFATQGKVYVRPEPRISASYMLNDAMSVKASFATMNQYIHLLTNTGIGLPTDLWVPSTANVVPQQSNQVAGGVTRDFNKGFYISLEGYYKSMNHIIGYKEGASFLETGDILDDPTNTQENSWENNVTQGKGWSYGMEILLQKKEGKISGWIGYTLSWTQLQFDELNYGKKYYARYDRRHDISVVGIYKFNDHFHLATTWVYGSGNAVSLPLATYSVNPNNPLGGLPGFSRQVDDYGNKNGFRMAPYHRLDIGLRFTKKKSWGERTWELGFYNAYSRANPFFYYSQFDFDKSKYVLKQISLFPVLPYLTYNFKF